MLGYKLKTVEGKVNCAHGELDISASGEINFVGEIAVTYDCPECDRVNVTECDFRTNSSPLEVSCNDCETALHVKPIFNLRVGVSKIERQKEK